MRIAAADPLVYRRLASPLHSARAWIGAAWAAALVLAALVLSHPLSLGALALAVILAGAGAGVGRRLLSTLPVLAIVAIPIVLVNVLVSRQGLTVFARLGDLGPFGRGDLTVEALVYGGVFALRIAVIMLVTTLASLAVDPDELLALTRRLSFRSALTASLGLRMIPLLAADARRLAEAQRTRARPLAGARGRLLVLGAVVSGAIDRAMDVAATLEVRGLASPTRPAARPVLHRGPLSRHDRAFLASTTVIVALSLAARAAALERFTTYPLIHATLGPTGIAVALALFAAVTLPFLDRRGID